MSLLRKIVRKVFPAPQPDISGPFHCPVCKTDNVGMSPLSTFYIAENHKYGHIHNIFLAETINYEHYNCKKCGASDRDRLYALFLDGYFCSHKSVAFLDIAPAPALAKYLKAQPGVQYRSMDLYMDGVDDKLDITDMHKYKEGQFDFLVCSHVLEHIPDDRKAMKEMYRVLKPGGQAIMMVPINLGVDKTLEDPAHTSIEDRWKYYGQDDHVRMYSKQDFIDRLAAVGFKVKLSGIEQFGADMFQKCAIFPTSVLYTVTK
jgi:SAM-dependent methyltransferase